LLTSIYIIRYYNTGYCSALKHGPATFVLLLKIITIDTEGYSVGAAGDINGDGVDDLVIGVQRADPNAIYNPG